MSTELEQRLNDLESQVIFQEDTINSLNQALIDQQKQLMTLQKQLSLFAKKVQQMQPDEIAPLSQETPPPHY